VKTERTSTVPPRVHWRPHVWTFCILAGVSISGAYGTIIRANVPDLRLVLAAKRADREAVGALLAQKADVNAREGDGATALHWAVHRDDLEITAMLLRAGSNVNVANDYGVTPVALACANANAAMVEQLLAAGADANAAVKTGETVLMTCARTGNVAAVRALLAQGADPDAKESRQDQTALMWAAARRHPQVVRELIEHGADIYARSRVQRHVISRRLQSELKYGELGRKYGTDAEETDIGGFTPLLFAARQGDIESTRLLLAHGADINDIAPDGTSVLLVATHSGHRELAKLLLEQGANPNAATAGYTALHASVLTGDIETLRALLVYGARPNAQVTRATRVVRNGQQLMIGDHLLGATPFALAAKFAEAKIMRVLVAAGADATLPLQNGWTPLMLAAGAGWRHGTWDRRDRALRRQLATEVEMYDESGTLEVVKVALEAGAEINAADRDGNTALHHVVDKGFNGVVQVLAQNGARLDAKNKSGLTPLGVVSGRRRGAQEPSPANQATAELLRRLAGQ
jgi:ankyrin repeat protein